MHTSHSHSRNGGVGMRYLRRTLILPLLLIGFDTFLSAQEPNLTDAQRMDLAGRIKAVSTTASRTDVTWQQPAGPSLVVPIFCWECEFDTNGNQTRSGQMLDLGNLKSVRACAS